MPSHLRSRLSQYIPPLNFVVIHYAYFIFTILVSTVVFWGSSKPAKSVSFIDSLFLTTSAITEAGLNTVNLSTLTSFQQVIIFILMLLGSAIWVSIFVVRVRARAFEIRFQDVLEKQRQSRQRRLSKATLPFSLSRTIPTQPRELIETPTAEATVSDGERPTVTGSSTLQNDTSSKRVVVGRHLKARMQPYDSLWAPFVTGVGARLGHLHLREENTTMATPSTSNAPDPSNGAVDKTPEFSHLHHLERIRMGGVEYHAINLLAWIVPIYFVLWQLLGCLGLGAWLWVNRPDIAREYALNPFWAGAFLAVSAFNNNGYSLIDANMTVFQTADYMLLTMTLLMLAGNTCYPIFLRFIIWTCYKICPDTWQQKRTALRFLLDHPRRCYTNLFPSADTWWLVLVVILLNGVDWASFLIFNINNPDITSISVGTRVLDGLFQAASVRSGGFYVVPIPSLRIATQILYVIMMYISVYPIAITMRATNVYEERSLGIYTEDIAHDEQNQSMEKPSPGHGLRRRIFGSSRAHPRAYYVNHQLRAQLAHDSWWLAMAVLFIMLIESSQFEADPMTFSVFNVLFEVVSAYGCVGISEGVPWNSYSLSGAFHLVSKLIMCAVMIRGRHRGLPVIIDMAVMLPGESLDKAEREDARIKLEKRLSMSSAMRPDV